MSSFIYFSFYWVESNVCKIELMVKYQFFKATKIKYETFIAILSLECRWMLVKIWLRHINEKTCDIIESCPLSEGFDQ